MRRINVIAALLCVLIFLCSCSAVEGLEETDLAEAVPCSVHDEFHEAVFNTKLSSLYFLDGTKINKLDEETYSYYDLSSLPEAKMLSDNWLIANDGSVYRLDIGSFFREDYCSKLYQLYWDGVSADRQLELYATDTVLSAEQMSGRILCAVKEGVIVDYMFIENGDYSEYLDLLESGGELYTCDFYPQIGELHLVKTDAFESNEDIVNSIAKEDGILFIRHQILPETGYWSMTGLYVFTESGKVHVVYNGEITQTEENILDISFKYGNSAVVNSDLTVDCERNSEAENWTNVKKVLTSELFENTIALSCNGKVFCSEKNKYSDQISEWTNVRDIAIMKYDGSFYPMALTDRGTFLVTDDNPFISELSGFSDVSEFCVSVKGTENFAVYAICADGTILVCK